MFQIDRSAISLFGIHAFGQHLNGYVQTERSMSLWIARRAPDRYAFPDRLDNMVAGGLPHSIGPHNEDYRMLKERLFDGQA